MTDTIAELGALRKGIQDALDGVTPNTLTYTGWVTSIARKYLNGEITYSGNRQTPVGRVIGFLLENFFISFDFTTGALDTRITFTRASTKTYFDSTGTLQTAAVDAWPAEYDPVTLAPLGRSVWEQRTNLLLNSTIDGANLATQNVAVAATAYTLSFYGTGTVTLSGASTAGPLVGSGVYPTRSTLTFTPSAGTLTLTVTGTVQFANLEAGSFATPFIPTAGATATRSADIATITGTNFSSWYNQSEGTFVTKTTVNPGYTAGPVLCARATSDPAKRIQLPHDGAFAVVDGTVQVSIGANTNESLKRASAYKLNDFANSNNGGAVTTDSAGTVPSGIDMMTIGKFDFGGAESLNGWIQSITYYRTRLSDAQLQALTA